MTKSRKLSSILLLLALCGSVQAQLVKGGKDTIFIGKTKIKPSVVKQADDGQQGDALKRVRDVVESQMPVAVSATRVFQLIERERLDELMQEGKIKDLVEGDKQTLDVLQKVGAKYALFPEIDAFENRGEMVEMKGTGQRDVRFKGFVSMTSRIVDVTTGKLLPDMASIQLPIEKTVRDGETSDAAVVREQLVVEVGQQLSKAAIARMIDILRPAKVLVVTGKQVMINRGTEFGFEVGASVEFFVTADVTDADTGEVFKNEAFVGKGVIERADVQKCFAKMHGEDTGVMQGCIVKLLRVPQQQPDALQAGTQVATGPATTELPVDPKDITRIKYSHKKIEKTVIVTEVKKCIVNGFLKVTAKFTSTEATKANGTFKWFGADDIELSQGEAISKPIYLNGNQSVSFSGIAPDEKAATFALIIEPTE